MTMTDDRMALIELIEQGADGDLVREMLAFAAERMMDLEIEAKTGAPSGSAARSASTTATATASGVDRDRPGADGPKNPATRLSQRR
jgi:hypothetical protein